MDKIPETYWSPYWQPIEEEPATVTPKESEYPPKGNAIIINGIVHYVTKKGVPTEDTTFSRCLKCSIRFKCRKTGSTATPCLIFGNSRHYFTTDPQPSLFKRIKMKIRKFFESKDDNDDSGADMSSFIPFYFPSI